MPQRRISPILPANGARRSRMSVISGTNAVAFTRKVRAVVGEPRGMATKGAHVVGPSFEARKKERAPQDDGRCGTLRRVVDFQHAAADLVFLDRFELRLEIALAKTVVALALDELE